MFSRIKTGLFTKKSSKPDEDKIAELKRKLAAYDAVVIGAGAGLSAAAGFEYGGAKFQKYFGDLARVFGIKDMYSGGFYPYPKAENRWAFWSRNSYFNRYVAPPKPVYEQLLKLVREKDYFVLTTNVDHQFQRAGFSKKRLFYTQGDYGLWQCATPCHGKNYDNREKVEEMLLAQGFVRTEHGIDLPPEGIAAIKSEIPTELIPKCPVCGEEMTMNLRVDDSFLEDAGWLEASERYREFLAEHKERPLLFLEIGTGYNTPGIIKYPFWQMTAEFPSAYYICLNLTELEVPEKIAKKSLSVGGDFAAIVRELLN